MRIGDDITACILVLNDEYFLPYVLESSRGRFSNYVIYDVGSTDKTKTIIDWFMSSNKEASYFYRNFDQVPPKQVQGTFRNSMIAEAGTDYYFLLDGDEVYSEDGWNRLAAHWWATKPIPAQGKYYAVVRRCEVSADLTQKYNRLRTHHRVYHRLATFGGPHPGEWPIIEQKPKTENDIPDVVCYHFHNAERSSQDVEALKRADRKNKPTYHPGKLTPFNLLEELPILQKRIEDFPVAPALRKLQFGFTANIPEPMKDDMRKDGFDVEKILE